MKTLSLPLALFAAALLWQPRAAAVPIPCIICGSTPVAVPGVEATVSYAVITGAHFGAELAAHGIGFGGAVPPGTLGPIVIPAVTDYVYLYQLVNDGPSLDFLSSYTVTGGVVGSLSGAITAGGRLESTLFLDPNLGPSLLVDAAPAVALKTPGLSAGPLVDFQNGLGAPLPGDPVLPWGPCLGSDLSTQCSDGIVDLLPSAVVSHSWQETPSGILHAPPGATNWLDPLWSGSVIWFSSPNAPAIGLVTVMDAITGFTASGAVVVPGAVPEPATLALLGLALPFVGCKRRNVGRR